MASAPEPTIRFEGFDIDRRRGELRKGDETIAIEPQVLDLLAFLASEPGRVFSRDEIIESVWNGRIVSDSAIATRINAARQAVDDDGKSQRIIRTIPRRGFLFVPETQVAREPVAAEALAAESRGDGLFPPLPNKPSIAVLPFENLSGDPEQTYFSDGITDDIITELSRYGELFVIGRHSSFAYRDDAPGARVIAQELGVRHVLRGSVRRVANRIRITVQLIDATTGDHIWAERYDRDLEDVFAVQDEITGVVVNTLVGELTRLHTRRVLSEAPRAMDAYDHGLRAMELLWRVGPRENILARQEAERAVELDPGYSRAHAMISWTHITDGSNRWGGDPAAAFDRSFAAAVTAVEADDREPWAHTSLGWSHIWGRKAHEPGLAALRRATALNPSSAHFRSMYAWGLCYSGSHAEALVEMQSAIRLNPHYPVLYRVFIGRALFHLYRFDEALVYLERVTTAMAEHSNGLALVAACYAGAGQTEDAGSLVQSITANNPDFTLGYVRDLFPYAKPEDRALLVEMLERAGLPE